MRVKVFENCITEASQISKISKVNAANEVIACGISVLIKDCYYVYWYDLDVVSLIQALQDLEVRLNSVLVNGYLDMSDMEFDFLDLYED